LLEGGPDKGVSYDNIVVDSNGNNSRRRNGIWRRCDDSRKSGCWHLVYNTASDEATFVFELDENAAGAEFNDPEEPGEWETSIVEVDQCPPGKARIF